MSRTETALAAALVGGMAWLYAEAARGLVAQWVTNPDASYGVILAGFAVLLIWRRRRTLVSSAVAAEITPWGWHAGGLLLLLGGLLLYQSGIFAADLFAVRVSFVVVAAGGVLFVFGRPSLSLLLAPLIFLFLAIPLPELVVNALTLPLQLAASRVAEATLSAAAVPVFRDGNVLELPSATLQVAEACSGLRSAVSLASVGVLLAWTTDWTFIKRTALVAATLPVAICVNGLRVAATGIACEVWGRSAARDPWHSLMGWITFVLALASVLALQRLMTSGPARSGPARSGPAPVIAHPEIAEI